MRHDISLKDRELKSKEAELVNRIDVLVNKINGKFGHLMSA